MSYQAMVEEEGPACQSCRKKKAKCDKRQPCLNCARSNTQCVYIDDRVKPGLRTGAVESLSRRVAALENMFLGQGLLWQQVWDCLRAIQGQSSTTLNTPHESSAVSGDTLRERTNRLKTTLSNLAVGDSDTSGTALQSSPKRRRTSNGKWSPSPMQTLPPQSEDSTLPPDDLIDGLVEIYFANIHPWIPILHVRQFRERMADPTQRQKLTTIFHAIVSVCVRFSEDPRLSSADVRMRHSRQSRKTVILQSMESFSVENLQALVICAFDIIGSGRGPSAWSIVGSMTRTVEQLQLSVEGEGHAQSAEFLIKRMAFLAPSKSWSEREERRRVFWNVFLMDRFCSIATGWNFSLTSADVKRRLPCEGALWEKGKPLTTPTPYFGVADKSSTGALPISRSELEDQESLGGFAYCIEASESLSLVTTFFLRHAVNVANAHDVHMWLMRFKELDLRLVQWKVFLPEKWRKACALNQDGNLDPNLTLAHITHNTAIGLLHQGIAYPSQEWQLSPVRLLSASSAETCLAAATEVAIIAKNYLQGSIPPTNAQFAFCLFISGRMLYAHSLHYNVPVSEEFDSLINSLLEISRRWNGPHAGYGTENDTANLASKFASRLVQARGQGAHSFDIRQPACSEEQDVKPTNSPWMDRRNLRSSANSFSASNDSHGEVSSTLQSDSLPHTSSDNGPILSSSDGCMVTDLEGSPDSISLAFPPLPLAFQSHGISATQTLPTCAHQSNLFYAPQGESGFEANATYPDAATLSYSSGDGFKDLNSFFEYPFQPTQRISRFSGS